MRLIIADFKAVKQKFLKQGIEEKQVDSYLGEFKKFRDNHRIKEMQDRDIDYWGGKDFVLLENFIDQLKQTPSKTTQRKIDEEKGYETVEENSEWVIYRIYNFEAAQKLGTRNWCIVRNRMDWDSMSELYDFYFAISKVKSNKGKELSSDKSRRGFDYEDPWHIMALQVDSSGKKIWWNAHDKSFTGRTWNILKIPSFLKKFQTTVPKAEYKVEKVEGEVRSERTRAIIIDNSGRLLLGIAADTGEYRLPGGRLKPNEHPVDGLLREVYEETGLSKFQDLEYLWPQLGNYIFIFIPEDAVNVNCTNDPSKEFKSLEWVMIDELPINVDSYSEEIIYRFLRVGVLQNGKEDEVMPKDFTIMSSHIDVLVDGKKAFQLDDDTIWETLPRLAQEQSKGRKIEFKQILDKDANKIPEVTKMPKEPKEKILKKNVKSYFLSPADTFCFDNFIRIDPSSELLNPSVRILKMADTFDNTLLFDGQDEFWITKFNRPVWRSSFDSRYASYDEVIKVWNSRYPEHSVGVDWLKELLHKIIELPKELKPESKKEKEKEKEKPQVKKKS